MLCANGHTVKPGEKFCGTCGISVANEDLLPDSEIVAPSSSKRRMGAMIVIASVLILIAAALGISTLLGERADALPTASFRTTGIAPVLSALESGDASICGEPFNAGAGERGRYETVILRIERECAPTPTSFVTVGLSAWRTKDQRDAELKTLHGYTKTDTGEPSWLIGWTYGDAVIVANSEIAQPELQNVLDVLLRLGAVEGFNRTDFRARPQLSPSLSPSALRSGTTSELNPVFKPDGLGPVLFGDEMEPVIAFVQGQLDQQPERSEDQVLCFESRPQAQWPGLTLWFTQSQDGISTFLGWRAEGRVPLPFATSEGITLGSSVTELRAAFGNRLKVRDNGRWSVDEPEGDGDVLPSYYGTLTGDEPSDTVLSINAGEVCGNL